MGSRKRNSRHNLPRNKMHEVNLSFLIYSGYCTLVDMR
ncbi:Uncharacterised protein [Vibrio cholerae]|uniref:Uncharacterized protein n=1 Tax=Vibrio cholerae TaxID=666 RepID=A0A655YDX4_VIBCL|nr:Uncharacterised protein [Vibrio cholerae]CSH91165.1 Uncharacterised protein [Vibrio cholerae]